MSLSSKIKSNPLLKKAALKLLVPANDFRPRLWVRLFLNPFKHKKGKGTIIRRSARMDVFPYNHFELGNNSIIEDFCTINNGVGDVSIGEKSIIGIGSVVIGPVEIGNNVMLAQHVVISGLNHGYQDVNIPPSLQPVTTKAIKISDDVWIGANSVVTAGVSIGRHAVIAAGSVVTRDIPAYCVAAGSPARVIKRYNFEKKIWEKEG